MPFAAEGYAVTATRVPHYTLDAYALRLSDGEPRRSRTRETPARRRRVVEVARGADLFLCEATLAHGDLDGQPRGHLSLEEAEAAFEESGAETLLVTHRPAELPVPHHHLLAFDGLAVDV